MSTELLERIGKLEERVKFLEEFRMPPPNGDTPERLVRALQQRIAHAYGMTVEQLLGKRRHAHLVWPRHLCMWLARRMTGAATVQLGEWFCRDHSDVVYALGSVGGLISADLTRLEEVQRWCVNLGLKDAEACLSAEVKTGSTNANEGNE